MRKLKLFMAALALTGWGNFVLAQTDVTSTYLTNADFSQGTPIDNHLCGYGGDMEKNSTTYYGFQGVTGWTSVVLSGDNSNATYPNTGMGGAVFAYGSNYQLKGNNVAAPATNPGGEATGNALGFFAVWGCGGYYYQAVTFPAGKYTLTFPIYCQSGTQANETQTGFFPTSGTNRTVAINTTVDSWVNQTVSFTLTAETAGQIRIGYKSTGGGSSANPMLFFDGVKIEFTAEVVKTVLSNAITAATTANATLNSSDLASAIATAQAVYDNANATQDEVNAAAATLNAATELAMSAAGDVTAIYLSNPGFESCTETTTNAAAGGSAAPLAIDGNWTQVSSAAWSSSAVVAYGGAGQVNGASAPASDNAGNSGKTLGVSVGWGGTVTYQSDAMTLPAGAYTLSVNAYNNLSGVTQFKSLFGFVPTEGSGTLSTKTAFAYATWETDQVTFTLNEATEGKIQIGGEAISGGSGSNAKVFFDNITISYKSFLDGAKEAWDNAVAAAQTAISENPNVTGEELTALNAELAKAEPTTVDGYNAATEALTTATTALTSAAASYNALTAVNGMITAAGELQYANQAKKPSAEVTATSATDANTKTTSQYTALRAYYESNAKAEGVTGATDYSSAIAAANADTNTGWTKGVGTNQGQGYTDSEGIVAAKYLDGGWAQNAACNIDMTRTVEVPAGTYLLTVKARGAVDLTEYTLSIAGKTINLPHSNGGSNGVFGNGWEDASIEFESDGTAQTLEIIAKSTANQQWMSINDFRLVQLKLNSDAYASTTDDYANMNTAITNAEAKTLGFEAGEYAPYVNANALKALAEAKAMDQTAVNTNLKTTIALLVEAMNNWTANTDEVNAVNTALFTSGDVTGTGWTQTQTWGQVKEDVYSTSNGIFTYGEVAGFEMPLKANTVYKLTFNHRAWDGTNAENGGTVSVLCGEDGLAATSFAGQGTNTTPKTETFYFKTGAAGNYVFTLNAPSGRPTFGGVTILKAVAEDITISENATAAPTASEYANVTLERGFNKGWNAVCLPFATPAFNDAEIAEFDGEEANGENITLKFKKVTAFEANKPYLVYFPNAVASGKRFEGVAVAPAEVKAEGTAFDFMGTYTVQDIAAGDYVVSGGALKKASDAISLKPTRTYFTPKTTSTARIAGFTIDGNVVTGISTIFTDEANTTEGIYNLQGQKVNGKAQKGIYIVNGKKVIK